MFRECRLSASDLIKKTHLDFFGTPMQAFSKPWIPNFVCGSCVTSLRLWASKKRPTLKFKSPMIWREPTNHHDDFYFCVMNITRINRKNSSKWTYPNLKSAIRPILNTSEEPVADTQPSTSNVTLQVLSEASDDEDSDFSFPSTSELVFLTVLKSGN